MKLYNRKTSYYTIITASKCLVSKYGKKQIWRSLNTKDYKLASCYYLSVSFPMRKVKKVKKGGIQKSGSSLWNAALNLEKTFYKGKSRRLYIPNYVGLNRASA